MPFGQLQVHAALLVLPEDLAQHVPLALHEDGIEHETEQHRVGIGTVLREEDEVLERVVRPQLRHVNAVIEQHYAHRGAHALGHVRGLGASHTRRGLAGGGVEGGLERVLVVQIPEQPADRLGVQNRRRAHRERAWPAEGVAVEEVQDVTKGGGGKRLGLRERVDERELGSRVRQREHGILALGEGREGGVQEVGRARLKGLVHAEDGDAEGVGQLRRSQSLWHLDVLRVDRRGLGEHRRGFLGLRLGGTRAKVVVLVRAVRGFGGLLRRLLGGLGGGGGSSGKGLSLRGQLRLALRGGGMSGGLGCLGSRLILPLELGKGLQVKSRLEQLHIDLRRESQQSDCVPVHLGH